MLSVQHNLKTSSNCCIQRHHLFLIRCVSFRGHRSPTSLSSHPLPLRWWITWWPLTLLTMTLVLHHDPAVEVVQVVPLFCPAPGQVEEATVGPAV